MLEVPSLECGFCAETLGLSEFQCRGASAGLPGVPQMASRAYVWTGMGALELSRGQLTLLFGMYQCPKCPESWDP